MRSRSETERGRRGEQSGTSPGIFSLHVCVVMVTVEQLTHGVCVNNSCFLHSHSDICPDTFTLQGHSWATAGPNEAEQ